MQAEMITTITKTNEPSSKILDDVVKLCLTGCNDRELIVSKFVNYFINLNNIDFIKIGELNKNGDGLYIPNEVLACSKETEVYYRKNLFSKNNLFDSIYILFHELEHCKTFVSNQNKSVLRGDVYANYSDPLKEHYKTFVYYLSDNEHNSKNAEIEYLKLFITTAEKLKNEDVFLNNKKINRLIAKLKFNTNKREFKLKRLYALCELRKSLPFNKNYIYKYANNAFNNLKKINLQNECKELSEYYFQYILDYLITYKDTCFALKILNEAKNESFSIFQNPVFLKSIFNSGAIHLTNENTDEYIIRYSNLLSPNSNEKYGIINELSPIDVNNHYLLFYGHSFQSQPTDTNELLNKYNFKGIPVYRFGAYYNMAIHGEIMQFNTKEEAYLEASKYINSSIMKDLTSESIKNINSIFDVSIIETKTDTSNKNMDKGKHGYLKQNIFVKDFSIEK